MWEKFIELVAFHFHFLETDLGFERESIKRPLITYGSSKLQVLIFYDADNRAELDLNVMKRSDDPRRPFPISIGMLMRLKKGRNSEGYESPHPTKEESLSREVQRLAGLLKEYGTNLLSGDMQDYERLQQIERELAKNFGAQRKS